MAEGLRELRRAQIIAAARAIVAEQGLNALTFGALEERLGFSRGVITYHFSDKDDVVHAVLESAIAEIDAAVRAEVHSGATAAEKIRAIVSANVRGFLASAEASRVLLSFWGQLSSNPRARKLNAALYARYRKSSTKLLRAARDEGTIADVDVDAVAAILVGLVIGIATQHYFEPDAIDVDAAVDEAVAMVLARLATPVSERGRKRRVG